MKPSEIRALLEQVGARPRRALGQNFLHDTHQLDRIVGAADLQPTDRVLEIGPGLGSLTGRLLDRVPEGHVLVVEKDPQLAALLRDQFGSQSRFEIVVQDALDWIRSRPRSWRGWKFVSNLPYSVGSRILVELARLDDPPEVWVVTLQLEVVQRLVAKPGSRDYGLLSLLIQARFCPGPAFRIAPSCFFPAPKVDSACLRLTQREAGLFPSLAAAVVFERLVRRAFSQRRKMVPKLLYQEWPQDRINRALAAAGIDPKARAERISLEQYAAVACELIDCPTPPPARCGMERAGSG
jgi:16S rRNA (adenine1518-N6/adenine1519-N6)-dimethyltransferase